MKEPIGLLLLALTGIAPASAADREITYTKDVAPLLWKHCAECHRPGEVGPFSLLTYRDAAKRSDFLREITAIRRMPPWKPVPGFGTFLDEHRLSDRELKVLADWADAGAPEGDPADLPAPPKFGEGWQLGTPDLIVSMPDPYPVPAAGGDVYRAFVIPIPLGADRWIKAIEFRPGNRRVVHHSRSFVDSTDDSRQRDLATPEPGFFSFGGVDIPKPGLGEWTPGTTPRFYTEGVAKRVRARSDLVLMMHYHPTGKPETDRSSVGFYFSKTPPTRFAAGIPFSTTKIDIPPGEKAYKVALTAYVPADCHVYNIVPHAHYLMRELKLTATRPDGLVEPLIYIKDWDFNWQGQYRYARPVALPEGTRLDLEASYDNSADNPKNPNSPPRRVRFGASSVDEMLSCHLQVIPDRPACLAAFEAKWPYSLESGDVPPPTTSRLASLKAYRRWLVGIGLIAGFIVIVRFSRRMARRVAGAQRRVALTRPRVSDPQAGRMAH